MKKRFVAALAAFCMSAAPAWAAEYFTTYNSTSGSTTNASLWIDTSDTANSFGGYDILSMHGDVNGDSITGLVANPNQPGSSYSAGNMFIYDNNLFATGPLVGNGGALFNTASGTMYNLWATGDTNFQYALDSAVQNSAGHWHYGDSSYGTLTTPTPDVPVPHISPPDHPVMLTFEDSRTHLADVTQSQGYQFQSAGHCCNYVIANDGSPVSDGTNQVVYTLFGVTMSALDGSRFGVTSIDLGSSSYADPNATYSVLLTGLQVDGTTVTTTLEVGSALQTYALSGFTDLKSLTIGHPTGGGQYMTFDNIAVTPSGAMAPEPASWAMMVAGFGIVGGTMRRRRPALRAA